MMKVLFTLDHMLWKYLVPQINVYWFKSRFTSLLALFYVSLYKLPRKFLFHYFRGKGSSMQINTQSVITGNPSVLTKLQEFISGNPHDHSDHTFKVCQTSVKNPNYKYSLGSFKVHCALNNGTARLEVYGKYQFKKDPDRITKYLHRWLYSKKMQGKAMDFDYTGNAWSIRADELLNVEPVPVYKNYGSPVMHVLV